MDSLFTVLAFYSFAMGAVVASFLNVVIWRVPRGESIVRPPSHCPSCGAAIRWWQNIPLVSWLALRGRCAACRAPISPRYIAVELLGGLLFLAAFWRFGFLAPVFWVWISLMIVGSFIDFDHQLLPDFVTVGGMVYGVALAVVSGLCAPARGIVFPLYPAFQPFGFPLWNSLCGLAVGFGLLWLVRFLGSKAFGREAMGLGDVFLMGAVGALFGPLAGFVTLVLSSVFGSLVGLALVAAAKARLGRFVAIPYGPYICLGCLVWMFAGPGLVRAYLSLLTP
jgi:leader peptidase (prepilin peptidase)/N-methyltransferase